MSVRVILIWALSIGFPSSPLTSPSMVVIWANEVSASIVVAAAATARLRNFIEPPTRLVCIKFQYSVRLFVTRNALRLLEKFALFLLSRFRLSFAKRAAHHPQDLHRPQRRPRNEYPLLAAERVRRHDR